MATIISSSDSDSKCIGFSAEDVSLANEKYDRIVQIENENISDLDISDFSHDEDENEESEVDDPDFSQQVDAGQQLFVWFLLCFVIYLPQYILNMHKKFQKLWINNKKSYSVFSDTCTNHRFSADMPQCRLWLQAIRQ